MAFIELRQVKYSYSPESGNAIDGVSLDIGQGEFVSLIGHNGSGKSTLARLLNALIAPDFGTVTVDGFVTSEKDSLFEVRKRVGEVFQNPDNQIVASIVEDDVAFGPENIGMKREDIEKAIVFALDAVDMLNERKSCPANLSGGQKQRVAVAGVLAITPKALVLDEATAMLDPKGRRSVMETARKLNREKGITVINITHYMDEVTLSDRVIVMNKGKIEKQGAPREIFRDAENLARLGLDVPLSTQIALKLNKLGLDVPVDVLDREELGEAICGLL